jgi:hypothetical protein
MAMTTTLQTTKTASEPPAPDPWQCSSCYLRPAEQDQPVPLTPIYYSSRHGATARAMFLPLGNVVGYLCPWCLGEARRVLAGS